MRYLPLSVLLAAAATVTAQSPLTTTFAGGNGQSGNMFDIVATFAAGITIDHFDVNLDAGTWDMEIYSLTIPGPYLVDVNNAAAWTLLGSATGVVSNGPGVPTMLPICVNEFIPAGATQAFYVTVTNGTAINYTNGTATGAVFASNGDLDFHEGAGLAYPFLANFNPRVFNGNIYYNLANNPTCAGAFASTELYGAGCLATVGGSFYEQQTPLLMDLADHQLDAIPDGAGGYVVIGQTPATINAIGSLDPAAVALVLGDDVSVAVGTLGLEVFSNGQVAFGPGNSIQWAPSVATLLDNPSTAVYVWTDLSPNLAGSGQVTYEEAGTAWQVTYDGVYAFGTTDPSTFQMRGDTATGDWTIAFGTALHTTGPEDFLVGYSVGGPSADAGPADLTATVATPLLAPADQLALSLDMTAPVLGQNWDITTSNIDAISPIAITFFGDRGAAIPFLAIGLDAPGCDINLATAIADLTGFNVGGSATVTVPIPNNPALAGAMLSAQSICLTLDNAANLKSSNGGEGTLGN